MKLVNQRLRELRQSLGLSQEAIGAQGFVSTPGWVKIENGTRQPGDALVEKLVAWLERDGYVTPTAGEHLRDELLALKYMGHVSPFVRRLARGYYEELSGPKVLARVAEEPPRTGSGSRPKTTP